MSELTSAAVEKALEGFSDPESGRNVVKMEQVSDVVVEGNSISLTLSLTSYSAPIWEETYAEAESFLKERFPAVGAITVNRGVHQRKPQPIGEIALPVKSVVAVGSGKGGVGKSTIAASIAYGLKASGCRVGLMDADVYGPSIPHLLGVKLPEGERPQIVDQKIQPIEKDGIQLMSMGFLVPEGEAVVWRGPMLHGAIMQFLRDTSWNDLDYLIIDMPPGTGDIPLTLSQMMPLTGSVVVCTPQDVALLDAVKAIMMFRKVNIPVLGMVENMSGFVCPDCTKRYDIFGSGGARKKAESLDVPMLGEVPINVSVRERCDAGAVGDAIVDDVTGPTLKELSYQLVKNICASRRANPPLPTLNVL